MNVNFSKLLSMDNVSINTHCNAKVEYVILSDKRTEYSEKIIKDKDVDKLFFIISGNAFISLNGRVVPVSFGDMLYIPANVSAVMGINDNEYLKYCLIGISGSDVSTLMHQIGFDELHFRCVISEFDELTQIIKEIVGEYFFSSNKLTNSPWALSRLINYIVQDITKPDNNPSGISKNYVQKIINYINLNYMKEDLSIEQIVKYMNLSSTYVRNLFMKHEKTSIKKYIIDLRMKKAQELLHLTDYTSKYIAHLVGYSDEYYFSKEFKKYFNITPIKYRQQSRHQQKDDE